MRWLDLTALRPLDVILTRPKWSPTSKAIALASGGKYSHSELVLSQQIRFEAMKRTGVQIRTVEPHGVACLNGRIRLLLDVSSFAHVLVLRHPDAAMMDVTTLENQQLAAIDEALAYNCFMYPGMEYFIPIAKRKESRFGKGMLAALAMMQNQKENPGPFCSELVVQVLAGLGLAVFEDGRQPNEATPSDLAVSNLRPVGDALLSPTRDSALTEGEALEVAARLTRRIRASMASHATRMHYFAGLKDVIGLVKNHAVAEGTPQWQLDDAIQSLDSAIESLQMYERCRVLECVAWEKDLACRLVTGSALDGLSIPNETLEELIAQEPAPHIVLRSVAEFYTRNGIEDRLEALLDDLRI